MTTATEDVRPPLDAGAVLASLEEWWRHPRMRMLGGREPSGRIAGGKWDQPVPEGTENPYWEIIRQMPLEDFRLPWEPSRPEVAGYVTDESAPPRMVVGREGLCGTFSWAIPSPGDIAWMCEILGGRGTVEVGAGGGYWAWQMRQAGIDAVAYEPTEVADNKYVRREWAALAREDCGAAKHHPDRALFLCWPSYGELWAEQALASYEGDMVIYCGEGSGGCCADDGFFRLLEAEFEEAAGSPAHVSYWGIHCRLTAWKRRTA